MPKTPRTLVRRTPWPQSASQPVGTPLQPSVVYATQSPDTLDAMYEGGPAGYVYAREGHPNADVLATKIDGMEGAEGGIITSSGMSAISAVLLGLLNAGDHLLGGDQLYGRCLRLLNQELPRWGIETSLADPTDIAAMPEQIRGYGHVKHRHLEEAKAREAELLEAYRSGKTRAPIRMAAE